MDATSHRKRNKSLLHRPLVCMAVLGGGWLAVLCLGGQNGLATLIRCRSDIEVLRVENEILKARNAELEEEIRLLRDDDSTIETYARCELSMIRPGDKVYYVTLRPPGGVK